MNLLIDSFWRALAYCLHPRVVLLSLLPLLLIAGMAFALGWFFWEDALSGVVAQLHQWKLLDAASRWLETMGVGNLRAVIAPLIVVALAVPFIVVASLLAVGVLMTPAIVRLVTLRRFPALERRHGEPFWRSLGWNVGSTVLALLALVLTMPLWLIPPVALVLPPLIWGWLAYRVMGFDALAEHATPEERRQLMRRHRWPMMGIGILTGYAGAAPSLVWAVGAAALILAPLLIIVSIWLYTLVFAFSSLWFAHYGLAALHAQRQQGPAAPPRPQLEKTAQLPSSTS
ncbi:EI24 domain-containing protein [Caldimonas brevitalea]|uniref:Membrane protein n=1 Tax=Caldimonas brevitalea TaxID=413882 RepID=A0A0G3BRL7_9BURK|nr:EI24 domain-containing protein [Caldimonas brevitalea]AKJ30016.1 membrane protein [Caldimonas brevitalea]